MSAVQRFFSGVVDTGDHQKEAALKTRYYRNGLKDVLEVMRGLAKQFPAFRLIHVDPVHGEVMFEYKNGLGLTHDLVVTVIELTPIRLAVDIHAALRAKFFDFGWNVKAIRIIYDYLDRHLTRDSGSL